MGTRCLIAIKENDCYEFIYNNWDGGEYVGNILKEHYTDSQKIRELFKLGDISILAPRVAPDADETHSFENPIGDVTIAYHRDRGDYLRIPRFGNKEQVKDIAERSCCEYIHVFENDEWTIYKLKDF